MLGLADVSHAGLAVLVGLQAMVLRTVMQETLHLKRTYQRKPRQKREHGATTQPPIGPMLGAMMPPISVDVLDSSESVTETSFREKSTALLFLKVDVESTEIARALIYSIWNQVDGCLYLVCGGTESQCRELRDLLRLPAAYSGSVKVIVDRDGALASRLGVVTWPSSIVVDDSGTIRRTGRPSLRP